MLIKKEQIIEWQKVEKFQRSQHAEKDLLRSSFKHISDIFDRLCPCSPFL